MADSITATVNGWSLMLVDDPWDKSGVERWFMADPRWDGPNDPKPLREWPAAIAAWEVEKQKANGFRVWLIDHESPKYWTTADAVFRSGIASDDPERERMRYTARAERMVHMRNGSDPKSLFGRKLSVVAPDTEEVAQAIERARVAHQEAVEAGKRFRAAVAAIPRLTETLWKSLPEKNLPD